MKSFRKNFGHLFSEASSFSFSKLAICALALGLSTPANAEYLAYCLTSEGRPNICQKTRQRILKGLPMMECHHWCLL